ncbi:MAG: glycosyltransferase family 2 protein [Pseudohongiellaceae bacterium]
MIPDNFKVAILLSTYNGGKFLERQLDSVLKQTFQNYVIVIRDDGSTDNTLQIIDHYLVDNPDRIRMVNGFGKNLGPSQSFGRLVEYVLANKTELGIIGFAYIAFCDQDDVWDPKKLEITIEALLSKHSDPSQPVLVHTDLRVVDEQLKIISSSLAAYQHLRPQSRNFGRRLVENSVTGCTVLINESLANKAIPVPESAVMHDWWLALVASISGEILFVNQATVNYRQHSGNLLGAVPIKPARLFSKKLIKRVFNRDSEALLRDVGLQSIQFKLRYSEKMGFRQKLLCGTTGTMRKLPPVLQKIIFRFVRLL